MKTGILYFTTCFHGFGILRHVDPFVRILHIYSIKYKGFWGGVGGVGRVVIIIITARIIDM